MTDKAVAIEEELTPEELNALQGVIDDDSEEQQPEQSDEVTDVEKPAAEASAEEETDVEAEGAGEEGEGEYEDKKKREPKKVPLKALHEEREKRKKLQEELERQREMMARLEERTRILLERFNQDQQPQQQEEQAPPDPNEDPYSYMAYLGNEVQQLRQMTEQERAMMEQQRQMQQMLMQGEQLAVQYREQVGPDIYDRAFEHVTKARIQELKAFGLDDMQAQQQLQMELTQGMIAALQSGKNPGELLMEFARARGFNPDAVKQQSAPVEKSDVSEKARRIEEGQRKTKGLFGGGGRSRTLTVEDIANMSDEEFMRLLNEKKMSTDELLKKVYGA